MLESFYRLHVFFIRNSFMELSFSQKSHFPIKKLVFGLCSITFAQNLLTRWHLGVLWPPYPLNISYYLQHESRKRISHFRCAVVCSLVGHTAFAFVKGVFCPIDMCKSRSKYCYTWAFAAWLSAHRYELRIPILPMLFLLASVPINPLFSHIVLHHKPQNCLAIKETTWS